VPPVPSLLRTSLLAAAFLAIGPLLHASDTPSSGNYKDIPVNIHGKALPVRVQQQSDPLQHASFPDELDSRRVFSATNEMANKSFTADSFSSDKNADLANRDHNSFPTRSFTDPNLPDHSDSRFNSKTFATTSAYSRTASGYDKSFATSNADIGQNKAALLGKNNTSDLNHAAILGGPDKPEVLASNSMSHKQYLGPGAQKVPDGFLAKDNIILSRMSGVPDRPLSIDEVRNLINHGTAPDTTVKPDAPSKPLNDPDYQPEPLRDIPVPAPGGNNKDDDKDDAVPPPGMMSLTPPPENSEPLPQQ
jgi:hypothetical protein